MKQIFLSINDIGKKLVYILDRKQKRDCVLVFVMTLIGAMLETIGVSIILPLVQAMMYPDILLENKIVNELVHALHIEGRMGIVGLMALVTAGIYIVKNVYMVVLSYVRANFAGGIQKDLGVHMMQSYMSRGYVYFLGVNTNQLHRGITGDVAGVYTVLYNGFRLAAEVFTVIAIGIYIMMTDILMSTMILVVAGISILVTFFVCKQKMRVLGEKFRFFDAKMKMCSTQTFQGIKEVLTMNKQDFFARAYEEVSKEQRKAMVGQTVAAESPAYIYEAACVIALIVAIYCRMAIGEDNTEFISNLAAMVVAAFRIMPSMGRISNYMNNIMFSIPSMNATYKNMKEADEYKKLIEREVNKEYEATDMHFMSELRLKDITWRYPGSNKNVIEHLDLVIKKGDSVAFIGESGSGKSTLTDIILGLLKPENGHVYMDGTDIRKIPSNWCKIIGYVPQAVYLLDDSIRNNVAYGIAPNMIDDEAIWHALEEAQLKKFVESLPDKLDTRIGDRGIRFSGGQRQRMAIARALYHEPDILILDEATSALDNMTEEAVMEAIDYLQGKKTLIIVAHRLTTIKKCNYIYEIKKGSLIERNKTEVLE